MSYLAFIRDSVSGTVGLVENLVEFIAQLSGPETGAISVRLPCPEMFVDTNDTFNSSEQFGELFNDQQRSHLEQFNYEIYSLYIVKQAQCKNAAWDVFLQQALTFQSDHIVLQLGDALSYTFTDIPWWFALALYSQACLAAKTDILPKKSDKTTKKPKAQPILKTFGGRPDSSNPGFVPEKKSLAPLADADAEDHQLELFATCALDQLEHFLRDKSAETSPADLIVMHQLCLAWSSRINGLRQRLTDLQRKRSIQKKAGEMRNEQSMQTQIKALQEAYTLLLPFSPLTYFSTWFETGKSHSITSETQRQLLENVVRQDRAYGLQRWMAREFVKPCGANSQALQQVSELFMAVCAWAAKKSADEYLAYQWRVFLLYCYELFALEFGLRKETLLRNLPPACIGLADTSILLNEIFDEANRDPFTDGAKDLFLKEYRRYQEMGADLADEFQKKRNAIYNIS